MNAHLTGPWRKPCNTAADQKGGIHDDDTATELGFRGGTVAGAIHMEQFPPLLEELFGPEWWSHGGMSLYFRSATVDLEPVRCMASEPVVDGDLKRCRIWMEKEDSTLIMEGTASIGGPDPESELAKRLANIRPATELRVFEKMRVSDQSGAQPTRIDAALVDKQLTVITEPLAYYTTDDTFGGRVLPATQVVRSIVPAESILTQAAHQPFVGLYGGIEIQNVNGPLLAVTDYEVAGTIVGLSDSPQTEIVWWRFDVCQGDAVIAKVLKMDRIMKGSSPLWDDSS
jgi:hypothetical protein